MLPSIAFPYHDPDLRMFPHLQAILPDLKTLFKRAYISPPLNTRRHASLMDWLDKEDFFTVFPIHRQMQIGGHFAHVYRNAARAADPDEIIHLAYIDRLSFALRRNDLIATILHTNQRGGLARLGGSIRPVARSGRTQTRKRKQP